MRLLSVPMTSYSLPKTKDKVEAKVDPELLGFKFDAHSSLESTLEEKGFETISNFVKDRYTSVSIDEAGNKIVFSGKVCANGCPIIDEIKSETVLGNSLFKEKLPDGVYKGKFNAILSLIERLDYSGIRDSLTSAFSQNETAKYWLEQSDGDWHTMSDDSSWEKPNVPTAQDMQSAKELALTYHLVCPSTASIPAGVYDAFKFLYGIVPEQLAHRFRGKSQEQVKAALEAYDKKVASYAPVDTHYKWFTSISSGSKIGVRLVDANTVEVLLDDSSKILRNENQLKATLLDCVSCEPTIEVSEYAEGPHKNGSLVKLNKPGHTYHDKEATVTGLHPTSPTHTMVKFNGYQGGAFKHEQLIPVKKKTKASTEVALVPGGGRESPGEDGVISDGDKDSMKVRIGGVKYEFSKDPKSLKEVRAYTYLAQKVAPLLAGIDEPVDFNKLVAKLNTLKQALKIQRVQPKPVKMKDNSSKKEIGRRSVVAYFSAGPVKFNLSIYVTPLGISEYSVSIRGVEDYWYDQFKTPVSYAEFAEKLAIPFKAFRMLGSRLKVQTQTTTAAEVHKFHLSTGHPSGKGPKFYGRADTHDEVKTKIDSLRKSHPEHQVTVENKHSGQVHTFRHNKPYKPHLVDDQAEYSSTKSKSI